MPLRIRMPQSSHVRLSPLALQPPYLNHGTTASEMGLFNPASIKFVHSRSVVYIQD